MWCVWRCARVLYACVSRGRGGVIIQSTPYQVQFVLHRGDTFKTYRTRHLVDVHYDRYQQGRYHGDQNETKHYHGGKDVHCGLSEPICACLYPSAYLEGWVSYPDGVGLVFTQGIKRRDTHIRLLMPYGTWLYAPVPPLTELCADTYLAGYGCRFRLHQLETREGPLPAPCVDIIVRARNRRCRYLIGL